MSVDREQTLPSVAVIIPTHNRWPTVCRAVESVLNQTYSNTSCIVVDDASSDETVTSLKAEYPQITVIENKTNQRQSFCRNLGVQTATADFICFLDSDDEFFLDAIESRMAFFLANPDFCGASFGVGRNDAEASPLLNNKDKGALLSIGEYVANQSWLQTSGFIIRREQFLASGGFKEDLYNKEDVELLLRLLLNTQFVFSGSEIFKVYADADNRARNDFSKIIEQSDRFSKKLSENHELINAIGEQGIRSFIEKDNEALLRAIYKAGQGRVFREQYRLRRHLLNKKLAARFKKRYWLSFLGL